MNAHGRRSCPAPRRTSRAAAAGLALGLVLTPGVALADTPVGWEDAPSVSGLQFWLVLFLIPLGLALVITLLAAIPGWVKPSAYEQGQPWAGDDEWFGGPKNGLEGGTPPKQLAGAEEQGGAGARY